MKKILIIAGETSGDMHGSSLIAEMKKLNPDISIVGIGGDGMISQGLEALHHIREMSFLGFAEVVKHIPFIRKVQSEIVNVVKSNKINYAVLIDYPGFNLSIAKKLKRFDVQIIYYISPQLWAWGTGRIKKIKQLVSKMLVVFPFEEKLYRDAGVDVEFVGHPLINRINNYNYLSKEELFSQYELKAGKEILLLLPGSRRQEVEKNFPEMIKAAEKISDKHDLQIVVGCADQIDTNWFSQFSSSISFKVVKDKTYELFKYSKFGLIKSGTSTLEAALFQLPMIIIYKTSVLTYRIGKALISLDKIGMPNIILQKNLLPELVQHEANMDNIFLTADKILSNQNQYDNIKNELAKIPQMLGKKNASLEAASIINRIVNER